MGILEDEASLRELVGDSLSSETLRLLLSQNGYNVAKAANAYFEKGTTTKATSFLFPTQTKPSASSSSSSLSSSSSSAKGTATKPAKPTNQTTSTAKTTTAGGGGGASSSSAAAAKQDHFYFIGRRSIYGYTLVNGQALRSHSLRINISESEASAASNSSNSSSSSSSSSSKKGGGGGGGGKGKKKSAAGSSSSSSSSGSGGNNALAAVAGSVSGEGHVKRDKYAGVRLQFETFSENNSNSKTTPPSTILRGRLPSIICDCLIPLLAANLIQIKGHVTFDVGAVNFFVDLPLSLHVHVSERFLDVTSPHFNASSSSSDAGSLSSFLTTSSSSTSSINNAVLIEAANGLLLWLQEGEKALAVSREKDKKISSSLFAPVSATTKTAGSNSSSSSSSSSGGSIGVGGGGEQDEDEEEQRPSSTLPDATAGVDAVDGDVPDESISLLTSDMTLTSSSTLPCAKQPHLLDHNLTMRKYQLQALHWMLERENNSIAQKQAAAEEGGGREETAILAWGDGSCSGALEFQCPHDGPVSYKSTSTNAHEQAQAAHISGDSSMRKETLCTRWIGLALPATLAPQLVQEYVTSPHTPSPPVGALSSSSSSSSSSTSSSTSSTSSVAAAPSKMVILLDDEDDGDEKEAHANGQTSKHHTVQQQPAPPTSSRVFYWNRYYNSILRKAPPAPAPCVGGILADEMGTEIQPYT